MRAEQIKTESDAERIVMSASMKRLEMQITSLQAAFDDKVRVCSVRSPGPLNNEFCNVSLFSSLFNMLKVS